jgi:hypothetical protein
MFNPDTGEEIRDDDFIKIIWPESHGFVITKDNDEYIVKRVFYHPKTGKISYAGIYEKEADLREPQEAIWPIENVIGMEGLADYGYYDINTGKIVSEEELRRIKNAQ